MDRRTSIDSPSRALRVADGSDQDQSASLRPSRDGLSCPAPRASAGGDRRQVLNRGNARAGVFRKPDDFLAFTHVLAEDELRLPMWVLAFCLVLSHLPRVR
jgi:hypothetical protein